MKWLYEKALNEGEEYALLDNLLYYVRNDELILHSVLSLEKFSLDGTEFRVPDVFSYMDAHALDMFKDNLYLLELGKIKQVEDYSFCGYRKLWRVEGEQVESIGAYSFVGTNLNGIHFPSLKRFHSYAFSTLNHQDYSYLDIHMTHLDLGKYSATHLSDCKDLLFRFYANVYQTDKISNDYITHRIYDLDGDT
jgi:hypothetical protein